MLSNKSISDESPNMLMGPYIHHSASVSWSLFILSFAQNTLLNFHPHSFPDQQLLNFNPGVIARRKLSCISQAVPRLGQYSRGTWGTRLQHTSKGSSIALHGKGRGPFCSFSQLLWAHHWQTTNVVQTALKLGRPPRSLGGETSYLLIKRMIRMTLWIKRFLVRNLKRKSKVLALEIKSWSCYLARTKLVNLLSLNFLVFKMGTRRIPITLG